LRPRHLDTRDVSPLRGRDFDRGIRRTNTVPNGQRIQINVGITPRKAFEGAPLGRTSFSRVSQRRASRFAGARLKPLKRRR